MNYIKTDYLSRCIIILEKSYSLLVCAEQDSIDYDIFRNSVVKSFEMTLEQSGKLLRKKLTQYFATKQAVDELSFKDIFRYALKHSLLTEDEVARWFKYRDNRNNTAHNYGQKFAEETLTLVSSLISDARKVQEIISHD